jgi:hypothetical protein
MGQIPFYIFSLSVVQRGPYANRRGADALVTVLASVSQASLDARRCSLLNPLCLRRLTYRAVVAAPCSDSIFVSLLRQADADHQCPKGVVCHERRMSCVRRATVREMKEDPSSSVIRNRSQATASCCGDKPWW